MHAIAVATAALWSGVLCGTVGAIAGGIMGYKLAREDNSEADLEVQYWRERAQQERELASHRAKRRV